MSGQPSQQSVDRDALAAWVAEWAGMTPPAVMFGLNHVLEMTQATPLGAQPFPRKLGKEERTAEAVRLVDRLVRDAENWAATMSRPQRFSISAHRDENPSVAPASQIPFIVVPRGDWMTREDVDPRDTVGNLQRLTNDAIRWGGTNIQQNMDRLLEENIALRDDNRRIIAMHLQNVREREVALSEKLTRDATAAERQLATDMKRKTFELLEVAARSWLSSHVSAENSDRPTVTREVADHLVDSLTEAQRPLFLPMIPAILSAMQPDERRAFVEGLRARSAPRKLNGSAEAPSPAAAPPAPPDRAAS